MVAPKQREGLGQAEQSVAPHQSSAFTRSEPTFALETGVFSAPAAWIRGAGRADQETSLDWLR